MVTESNITVKEVYDRLSELHPDKMLIDDMDSFIRGKLAGHIEVLLEIEDMLYPNVIEEVKDAEEY